MMYRLVSMVFGIFLTVMNASGCGGPANPVGQSVILNAGNGQFSVTLFDGGIKLSTRHLRLDVRNVGTTRLRLAYALQIECNAQDSANVMVTFVDEGPMSGQERKGADEGQRHEWITDMDQLELLPNQVFTVFIRTDVRGEIHPENVRIAWDSEKTRIRPQ